MRVRIRMGIYMNEGGVTLRMSVRVDGNAP